MPTHRDPRKPRSTAPDAERGGAAGSAADGGRPATVGRGAGRSGRGGGNGGAARGGVVGGAGRGGAVATVVAPAIAALAGTVLAAAALTACGHPHPQPEPAAQQHVTTRVSTPTRQPTPSAKPKPLPVLPQAKPLPRPPKPRTPAPPAGNPNGGAGVPAEAGAVDTSHPTRVIGTGTAASCTSAAVVSAVAAGGIITFNCGPAPVTIAMAATAKIRNANGPRIVLDGGGKVTLSGQGSRRILYMNTCDQAQGYTTDHCQDQDSPQLTVQNLTFANGNSTGELTEGGGGGAVFVRGGRFKAVNSRFVGNRCDGTGPDLGGAAIRVLSQYHGLPVYVTNSTFTGGVCSNGGALSSIGVSWTVTNSVFSGNSAIGRGANPARGGTPGGGSGGAIYLDGNTFTLTLRGTSITGNHANEGGGAVFFVSNDRTGSMRIEGSTLRDNRNDGFSTAGFPGIFYLGVGKPVVSGSTLR